MRFFSFAEIRAAGDCAALARDWYGAAVHDGRCAATWRGGDNPASVAIDAAQWYDHARKEGGGIIELAAFRFDGDIQQAQSALGEQYGLSPKAETGAAPNGGGRQSRYDKLIAEGYREVARYEYRGLDGEVKHVTVRMERGGE